MPSTKPNWIICLGGEDWWYHSHAHFDIQIMKKLSTRAPVLYVCSIGMRMPSISRDKMFWLRIRRKLSSVTKLLSRVSPQMYVYSPLPLPFYRSRLGRGLNTLVLRGQIAAACSFLGIEAPHVWVNTPTAWPVIASRRRRCLVYQRTDDYAAYDFDNFNSQYVRQLDEEMTRSADLVLHVSDELHDEARKITSKSILLPQGVDERFFHFSGPAPADLRGINRPIIGYVGGMDRHKFDTPLVADVVRRLPDCAFVLVGTPCPNVDELRGMPNVFFLGNRSHDAIPGYVHNFDVCILPTARSEWGLRCRPIKLMEYLAAAKPVVATNTPASARLAENIIVSDDAASWASAIRLLVSSGSDAKSKSRSPSPALTPWNVLADQIWERMQQAIARSG